MSIWESSTPARKVIATITWPMLGKYVRRPSVNGVLIAASAPQMLLMAAVTATAASEVVKSMFV